MKLLVELTYYRPHTSGLTIYAERMARAMVNRGHHVTILTSQYDKQLPLRENLDGVEVIRVPVLFRISKGVVMPSLGWHATKLIRQHDALLLHLPQFDATGFALRGRFFNKPTVITYHCDLKMPRGILSWLANQGVKLMNHLAAIFTNRIVTYTQDYADHSSLLKKFKSKVEIIDPPVVLPKVKQNQATAFKKQISKDKRYPIIGMAARFATEKGVEVLLSALEKINNEFPRVQVWFAGPYENILGEEQYLSRLKPVIHRYQESNNWVFVGSLNPEEMSFFYKNIDMLVIPSLNSTEAFGLVQIEAMMNGVPVIASDLPGVRQPVLRHKMGKIIPIGDSDSLAQAVTDICNHLGAYKVDTQLIAKQYAPDKVAEQYERLFQKIQEQHR